MKRMGVMLGWAAAVAALAVGLYKPAPIPTVLVVRMDMPFEDVVRKSSYPVLKASNLPSEDPGGFGIGVTWVSKPAVIIRYEDPAHGFELPPTTFAAVGYSDGIIDSVATSPMLKPKPYAETADVLEHLQTRFKAAGWIPWSGSRSEWFDLSPQGRKQLLEELGRYGSSGIDLVVPKKNLQDSLAIKCVKHCDEDTDQALFLIDVGMGKKWWGKRWNGE